MSVSFTRITVIAITAISLVFSLTSDGRGDDFYFLTSVSGDSIGDRFYNIATGRGDINGDGYEDVLIGAPCDGWSSYVKLFFGGVEFDTIPDLIFLNEPLYFPTCFAVSAFAGDVNNDGFDDILIGDPEYCPAMHNSGRAYFYYGGEDPDTIPEMVFTGEYFGYSLGSNVSAAGDVNGDGYDDWLILAPATFWETGVIYLYFGSAEPDSICDIFFEGYFRHMLLFDSPALGDINGDGFDDLIFYRWDETTGYYSPEIHLGSENMDTIPDLQWIGTSLFVYTSPISGAGDINHDGFNDWLMHSNSNVELYFGSPHPDTTVDIVIEPESPCDYVGSQVVNGDIDGDGIGDLILSGITYNGLNTGQVLGYCGGAAFDNNYDYFFDSGVLHLSLGTSLGLSDVNGDSIAEVLAGAAQYQSPSYWGPGQVWFLTTQPVPGVLPHQPKIPTSFSLSAFPNPFNPTTTIRFQLPVAGFVTLEIFDISGRAVGARHAVPLQNAWHPPGTHHLLFDGSGLSSGLYFCRIQMGDYSAVKKMVLLK